MKENASKSYQKRFIVIYMLCLVIALVPLLVFTQVVIKPQNLQQANIQTLNLIESKANEMGAWLDQRISEIRIINNFFQVGGRDFDTIKPYITSINDQVRDFYGNPQESYAIGKTDGLGWINDQLTINISQREYFMEAMTTEKEYVIGNPVVSKSDNEPIFLICYPLKDETGKA
ncbi:MAG: hypothetical protein J6K75_03215, partial [Erysipelotrichaceae bacterium]|nr:hypothetical protein [Erysipelotrichaceae bacterium]